MSWFADPLNLGFQHNGRCFSL